MLRACCFRKLVEDMKVSLVSYLPDNAVLLEQVVGDVGAHRFSLFVELDLEVLSVTTRVVVPQCLRTTKRF
jgi:hypothetical protein